MGLQITILHSFTVRFIEPCCFKKSETASSLWGQKNGWLGPVTKCLWGKWVTCRNPTTQNTSHRWSPGRPCKVIAYCAPPYWTQSLKATPQLWEPLLARAVAKATIGGTAAAILVLGTVTEKNTARALVRGHWSRNQEVSSPEITSSLCFYLYCLVGKGSYFPI